jgi:predicted  nucleic acid-binding Zn-ribbon protein
MAAVTNELMYELLKRMHHDISELRMDLSEVKKELNVIRGHMIGIQTDIHNIYGILGRHDERLDRIERRLELRELAEAQKGFDSNA